MPVTFFKDIMGCSSHLPAGGLHACVLHDEQNKEKNLKVLPVVKLYGLAVSNKS